MTLWFSLNNTRFTLESGTKEKKMFCYEKTNFQSYVEKELTDITKRIIDRKNKEDTNMNIVRKDDLIQYYPEVIMI